MSDTSKQNPVAYPETAVVVNETSKDTNDLPQSPQDVTNEPCVTIDNIQGMPRKASDNPSTNTDTTETSEKLKIQSVVEAVGFFIFPSSGFINLAFRELLTEMKLFESFQ